MNTASAAPSGARVGRLGVEAGASPIAAPLGLYETTVPADWLDYNGHMSEWCYLLLVGLAADAFFRFIGIDEAYRAVARTVRDFVRRELMPHEDLVERNDAVPAELAQEIRGKALAAGLYAANFPAELGGGGLDAMGVTLAERELGWTAWALQT